MEESGKFNFLLHERGKSTSLLIGKAITHVIGIQRDIGSNSFDTFNLKSRRYEEVYFLFKGKVKHFPLNNILMRL